MLGFALGTVGSGAAAFSLGACDLGCPWDLSLWGLFPDCACGLGPWAPAVLSCSFGLSLGPCNWGEAGPCALSLGAGPVL